MILRFTQLLHGLDTSADLTTQLSPSLVLSGIWWIRTRQERKSVGSRVDQFRDARKSGNYLNELNHIDDPVVLTVSQQPKSTFKGWLIFSPPYVVHETEPALVKLQIMEDTTKVLIKILSIIHEKRWKSLLHQWWHHHRWTSSVSLGGRDGYKCLCCNYHGTSSSHHTFFHPTSGAHLAYSCNPNPSSSEDHLDIPQNKSRSNRFLLRTQLYRLTLRYNRRRNDLIKHFTKKIWHLMISLITGT